MIARTGLVLAFLGFLTTHVAAAGFEFRGEFTVTAQNQTCTDIEGDIVGLKLRMRYSPPHLGGNNGSSSLSVFYGFGAENYRLPSGNIVGSEFKDVSYSNIFRYSIIAKAGAANASKMRFTSQKPSNLTLDTPEIRIKGDIKNFSDVGCNISFSATGLVP